MFFLLLHNCFKIYGNVSQDEMKNVCILCPKNVQVYELNETIQERIISGEFIKNKKLNLTPKFLFSRKLY